MNFWKVVREFQKIGPNQPIFEIFQIFFFCPPTALGDQEFWREKIWNFKKTWPAGPKNHFGLFRRLKMGYPWFLGLRGSQRRIFFTVQHGLAYLWSDGGVDRLRDLFTSGIITLKRGFPVNNPDRDEIATSVCIAVVIANHDKSCNALWKHLWKYWHIFT